MTEGKILEENDPEDEEKESKKANERKCVHHRKMSKTGDERQQETWKYWALRSKGQMSKFTSDLSM